jgi:SAM-dependent methyltransferase
LTFPAAAHILCAMAAELFNDLTDIYEAMIAWPKRLANEGPFYRRWFDRAGVRSVVDVACGTGRHAAMFHSWGLRVEAADISPRMIEHARAAFGQPPGMTWVVRGFEEAIPAAEPFDAAVCVGNSLALAPGTAVVEQAVARMLAAVRPGGLVIVQVLNLWALADGPCQWQKCRRAALPAGEMLLLKGVHRCGERGYVELVVADPAAGKVSHAEAVPFLGLEAADLGRMAHAAGAAETQFFGGYQDQPYDRRQSADLLLVARR